MNITLFTETRYAFIGHDDNGARKAQVVPIIGIAGEDGQLWYVTKRLTMIEPPEKEHAFNLFVTKAQALQAAFEYDGVEDWSRSRHAEQY